MNALLCMFFFIYGVYALFNNIRFWVIYLLLLGIYYYLTQIKLFNTTVNSIRRKIMIATWGSVNDPQIFAKVKLDITKIEPYLAEKSIETGEKLTLTIFIIKLLSIVLKKYPELCGYIKFGKFFDRENVDICCLVAVGDGQDLANTVIKNAENKNFKEICSDLNESVEKLRAKKSKEHNKKMNIVSILPTFLIGPIMQITSYVASIGNSVDFLGIRKYEFGTCVLTSIGSLGIEDGYAPIPPLSFSPLLCSVCKKKVKYYYDEKRQIQERSTLDLNFTIDHRFIDARIAEAINNDIKLLGENPGIFEQEMNKLLISNK